MKKLLNRLSTSGKLEADAWEGEGDEHFATHFRKSTNLPADTKDTSENIKVKKSMKMALSPRSSTMDLEDRDFSKKKSSSSGIKKDKEKLNDSSDKSIKKSGSLRIKSPEVKNPDSMKSPSLKSIFMSGHELEEEDSDEDSMEDEVPRSRGNSMHDDEEFTPITRVPSAPSPRPFTPSSARAASPQTPSSPFRVPSSPSPANYARASSPVVPSMARSASSPAPSQLQKPQRVVLADDFDLRFGDGHTRTESNGADDVKAALHAGEEHENDEDEIMEEDMNINQKGKGSGRFSFGKARKSRS